MKIENITTRKKKLICKIFKKTNLEVFNFQIFKKLEPKLCWKLNNCTTLVFIVLWT
jgi:hypothetical protein